MKKILALLLALLLLPAAALADVLAPDWKGATLDELLAAQAAIADQISQLRAAASDAAEALTFTGEGTSILSAVNVEHIPARVTINGAVKVTMTGGQYDHVFNVWQDEMSCEVLTDAAEYDLLVEGTGAWTVTIEPLKDGGTLELSGAGPYVSDFFQLPSATIVVCSMDASKLDTWSASLYIKMGHQYSNISSWAEDSVAGDSLFSDPLKLTEEAIVKPTKNRDQYYWIIDVPVGATWSITQK